MSDTRMTGRLARMVTLLAVTVQLAALPASATVASDLVEPPVLGQLYHTVTRPGDFDAQGQLPAPTRQPMADLVARWVPRFAYNPALAHVAKTYGGFVRQNHGNDPFDRSGALRFCGTWAGLSVDSVDRVRLTSTDPQSELGHYLQAHYGSYAAGTRIGVATDPATGWAYLAFLGPEPASAAHDPEAGTLVGHLPHVIPVGTTVPLQIKVPAGFTDPYTVVTQPDHTIRHFTMSQVGDTATAPVVYGPVAGTATIEVAAHGPRGGHVLFCQSVFVGNPPDTWQEVIPWDESLIRTEADARERLWLLANRIRLTFHLAPLILDSRLNSVAQGHCQDMVTNHFFGHTSPTQGASWDRLSRAGYTAASSAENIGYGSGSLQSNGDGFFDSPAHRDALLSPTLTHVGFGVLLQERAGRQPSWTITEDFAIPRGDTAAPLTPTPIPLIPAAPTQDCLISEMPFVASLNGWGPVERDSSNGETRQGDGHPLQIHGRRYAKGLGMHANGIVELNLGGHGRRLTAVVGIDDEVGQHGAATFEVWGDGQRLYSSGMLRGGGDAQRVDVAVDKVRRLRLIVTGAGMVNSSAHADWADARLEVTP